MGRLRKVKNPRRYPVAAPETVAGVRSSERALEESPDTTRQRAA